MPSAQHIVSDRKENTKHLLAVSLILSIFTLITFNIQSISLTRQVLGAKTERSNETKRQKEFWLEFLKENPGYLEGWIQLATMEYEEGNLVMADEYYLKAKQIDPNSTKLPW